MKQGVKMRRQLGREHWSSLAIKKCEAEKTAFHMIAVAKTVVSLSLPLSLRIKGKCVALAHLQTIHSRVECSLDPQPDVRLSCSSRADSSFKAQPESPQKGLPASRKS